MDADKAALEYVAGLAKGQITPAVIATEAEHFVVVPEGMELRSLRDFQFAEPPVRKSADVKVRDVASFAHYWKRFRNEDSLIFGDPKAFKFAGIIDYHQAGEGEARPRRHKVTLSMEFTERWQTWFKMNGVQSQQEAFATFIEDNAADIYAPPDEPKMPAAADMLEVSRSLEAGVSHVFKQAINLKNGQRILQYTEQINGGAGPSGDLPIPDEFIIRMPVFLGQGPVEVRCRLRFRIANGKLTMWFQMLRVDEMLAEEFERARLQVVEKTESTVILGAA